MFLFWILIFLMIAIAILLALKPLIFNAQKNSRLSTYDFQNELQNLQQEFTQGLIKTETMPQLQYELALNFINPHSNTSVSELIAQQQKQRNFKKLNVLTALFILIFIPIISITLYLKWGASDELQQWFMLQKNKNIIKKELTQLTSEQIIQKMQVILANRPKDAKGWYLLARVYESQNDYSNAVNAYEKAHQLLPNDLVVSLQLAQAQFFMNNSRLNDQAKQLIQQVLQAEPDNPMAINLLAVDAYQNKQYQKAINYWEKILPNFDPQSEEGQAILKSIRKAQQLIE